jgi:hypothetical protein
MLSSGRRPGGAPRRWRPPPPRAARRHSPPCAAPAPPLPPSSPLPLLLLCWCGDGRRGKLGAARVLGVARALIRGARVWGAAAAGGSQRPGRDAWRHRGGAAQLGDRHGRRDSFPPVSQSGDKRGATQAGDMSERGHG